MAQRAQSLLVFHGAVVLLIGSLFGFPVIAAIESGSESLHAWTSAHSAVAAGGVMMIALGAALHCINLGSRARTFLVWSLVAMGYGAIVGLGVGASTGMRGFSPTGPALNLIAFFGNLAVVWGSIVGVGLFIFGAFMATRRGPA